jgi:hypothetical protein
MDAYNHIVLNAILWRIYMKELKITLTDEEHKTLWKAKGHYTWKQWLKRDDLIEQRMD